VVVGDPLSGVPRQPQGCLGGSEYGVYLAAMAAVHHDGAPVVHDLTGLEGLARSRSRREQNAAGDAQSTDLRKATAQSLIYRRALDLWEADANLVILKSAPIDQELVVGWGSQECPPGVVDRISSQEAGNDQGQGFLAQLGPPDPRGDVDGCARPVRW
jgi:hypothetical protein